jgi:hypothetical protein
VNSSITNPYPAIHGWVVPERIFEITRLTLQHAGCHGRESGAVWLGRREEISLITTVILLKGPGIWEQPDYWHVSPEVLGAVTRWALPQGLCLLALVHTHLSGMPPLLSWTDRECGIRVPGVLAIIIPNGGDECDYTKWGWHVCKDGDYHRLSRGDLSKQLQLAGVPCEAWTASAENIVRLEVET